MTKPASSKNPPKTMAHHIDDQRLQKAYRTYLMSFAEIVAQRKLSDTPNIQIVPDDVLICFAYAQAAESAAKCKQQDGYKGIASFSEFVTLVERIGIVK